MLKRAVRWKFSPEFKLDSLGLERGESAFFQEMLFLLTGISTTSKWPLGLKTANVLEFLVALHNSIKSNMILMLGLDLDGGWFQYNPLLHIVMKVKTKNRHPSKKYWKLDRQADVLLPSWYCVKAGQGEKRAFFVACKSIYVLVTEMDTRHKKSLRGNRQRGKNGLFCVLKK